MGRREAFDPLRSYVVARSFSWRGKKLEAGEPFSDRSDMRRFRQLYDSRYLRMSEVDTGAPDFKRMKDDELRQWLVDHGRAGLAHPRSPRGRLMDRCQRCWLELLQENEDGLATGHDGAQGSGVGVQGTPPPRNSSEGSPRQRERLW